MKSDYVRTINTDVMVAGAGTAGIAAAIQSAREGNDVYLIEKTDRLGGIMSVCQGMPLGCAYPCQKVIGGIFEELVQRLMSFDPPAAWLRFLPENAFGWDVYYNQDIAMYVIHDMLEQAGVHLILNAITGNVKTDNNNITGVEYHDMTGTNLIQAKIYIDCTGNGDVASRAGVPYDLGDEKGEFMSVTLSFIMANVDFDKVSWDNAKELSTISVQELVNRGIVPEDRGKITFSKMVEPGRVYFNYIRERNVNGLDPDSVLYASNKARKRIIEIYEYIHKHVEGFQNAYLDGIGPILGIRDSRRMEGMHRLTKNEILDGQKFPDQGIVCCDNPVDDVARGKTGVLINGVIGKKGTHYYRIPFGTLVPKKIKNLMFAGRLLSSEALAMASARGMGSCMGMGQATGVASGIAIRQKIEVQDIVPRDVVDGMINAGMHGLAEENLV